MEPYQNQYDGEELEPFGKLSDKECCLVCLIITIFHVSFTGAIIYLIQSTP